MIESVKLCQTDPYIATVNVVYIMVYSVLHFQQSVDVRHLSS